MTSRTTGTTSADLAGLASILAAAEAVTSLEGLQHFFPANRTIIEGPR